MRVQPSVNEEIAARLDEVASLLERQEADRFRVAAWHRGADALRQLPHDVVDLVRREGREGLQQIPDIGPSLAGAIAELAATGRLGLLDRLRGEAAPEALLASLPGIGDVFAHRIHTLLGIETLEELELAAWDGRLETVPGFGPRRIDAIRSVLESRLSRSRARRFRERAAGAVPGRERTPEPRPSVADLLVVDDRYRAGAEADTLPRITPRRFNPHRVDWLPILHTERGPWSFHALYSNTALAHRLGRTRDWVVIHYERDGDEGQATVVTERRGELEGHRVVRGREAECARLFAAAAAAREPADEG